MYARNWMFTAFKEPVLASTEGIDYYVYQEEEAPTTGRRHYQGYIEFRNKQSLRSIKLLFSDMSLHLEIRKGTQEQAIKYCTKEETRVAEPHFFGKPKKQGRRNDLEEILQDVIDGCTLKEILYTHRGNALRMLHCIEKAVKVHHDLSMLDQYVLTKRKVNKDRLDEKILDDYEKKLFK